MMANWANTGVLEKAKEMWLDGASAKNIVYALGGEEKGYTRNAIIGKMNRLGLSRKKITPSGKIFYPTRPKPNNVEPKKPPTQAQLERVAKIEQRAISEEMRNLTVVVPLEERRNVMTATPEQCRWPYGHPSSPDFHFCHLDHEPGIPYCQVHRHHAYVKPTLINGKS